MSSSSVDGVCAMLNHACSVLEHDFREVLYGKLRQGFPSGFDLSQAYNLVQSSIQQGKLQASDTDRAKAIFLVRYHIIKDRLLRNNTCKNLASVRERPLKKIPIL